MRSIFLLTLLATLMGCLPEDEERCYNADDPHRPNGSHLVLNEATGTCVRMEGTEKDASTDRTVIDDSVPECSDENACTDKRMARCNQGTCEKCTDSQHCEQFTDTPVCNSNGNCVECIGNNQCDDATAPRCFAGNCAKCESDTDCTHIAGRGICSPDGTCVECTSEKDTACDGKVCNVLTSECTERLVKQTASCETCVSTKECSKGICATLVEEDQVLGHYCLPESDPTDGCTNEPPLSSTKQGTPIEGGDELTVCYPLRTTCEGLTDTSTRTCTKPAAGEPEGCGREDVDNDGYCVQEAGENYVCTTPCVNASKDCRSSETCVVPPGRADLPGALKVCPI